jgi:hypothetical protein
MSLINEALKQARPQSPQNPNPHLGPPIVPVYPSSTPPPPPPARGGKALPLLVVLLVVAAAAGGGVFFWMSQEKASMPAKETPNVAALPPASPAPAATAPGVRPAPVTEYGKDMQKAREAAGKLSAAAGETDRTLEAAAPAPAPVPPTVPTPAVTIKPAVPVPTPPAGPAVQEANGYKLTAVVGSGNTHMALVNDQIVRVGDKVGAATVLSVETAAVVLRLGDKVFELRLPPK